MEFAAEPPTGLEGLFGLPAAESREAGKVLNWEKWLKKVEGTPESVVLPPFVRFLYGQTVIQHARIFLMMAQHVALKEQPDLALLLEKMDKGYASQSLGVNFETYFAAQFIINLVSEVEHFLGSAVAAALRLHPEKIGGQTFKLTEIISATSTDELVDRAAKAKLNELMYEKPLDYIKKLSEILSVDAVKLEDHWPAFVELKARRDLGVHSNWMVNEIYLRKLKEAKITTDAKVGDSVIPDFKYLTQAIDDAGYLAETLATLLAEKWMGLSNAEFLQLDHEE